MYSQSHCGNLNNPRQINIFRYAFAYSRYDLLSSKLPISNDLSAFIRLDILGPILFLIYVNDITCASSKSKFTIFADDTALVLAEENLNSLHQNFEAELILVNRWIRYNKLILNVTKTN